ncbi:MAG: protein jag [Chloroflexi bacterium]|nr:MAG: protein jag [Chloroflexota bacterium]
MESVEVSAKTVDEAIDIALEDLGLKRSEVDIEVLTPGKPGLFGLGGEQARVRVTALVETTRRPAEDGVEEPIPEELLGERVEIKDLDAEEVQYAHQFLRELLILMDISADVSVREPETPADGLGRATAVLDVEGDDLGLLIGRRGTTLSALQYLINVLVTRKLGSRVLVTVDVEAYHRRREDTLRGLARRMADRVRQSRRPMTLEPMPAAERRIIHIALADDASVITASTGFGEDRKVVIRPRGNGGPHYRRDGPGRSPGRFQGPRI